MPQPVTQRDYFAELYCAGIFGDAGWSVYFPKRDVGFDFIVTKEVGGQIILRPVQVKGLYPTEVKGDKSGYGYRGELSAVHPEMVLVLAYFAATERGVAPEHIAYMPYSELKRPSRGGYRCLPAKFESGHSIPRREFSRYFSEHGLKAIESLAWGTGG
jgi:hypothetical protein